MENLKPGLTCSDLGPRRVLPAATGRTIYRTEARLEVPEVIQRRDMVLVCKQSREREVGKSGWNKEIQGVKLMGCTFG